MEQLRCLEEKMERRREECGEKVRRRRERQTTCECQCWDAVSSSGRDSCTHTKLYTYMPVTLTNPTRTLPLYPPRTLSACLRPMISQLSNMSFPGPDATHSSERPLHVECTVSQGSPVSWQWAPRVLGDTSPRLVEAKPATNVPFPAGAPVEVLPLISRSRRYDAYPGEGGAGAGPGERWG